MSTAVWLQVTLASVGHKPQNIVSMSRGVKVQADMAIEACVDLQFDAIVVPGVSLRLLTTCLYHRSSDAILVCVCDRRVCLVPPICATVRS